MAIKDFSFDHLVNYIARGEGSPVAWTDMSLTVNLQELSGDMLVSARTALDLWHKTVGFRFTEISTAADITFSDLNEDAYATRALTATGDIEAAFINVDDNWMDYAPKNQRWGVGDYGLQTFVHEVGHALGLHHPGPYNGTGEFNDDAAFAKDTWQYSVMSYFDQSHVQSYSYEMSGPAIADVAAIEKLYGPLDLRPGDSVYSLKFMGYEKFEGSFTLVDSGGVDTLDLRKGYVSDVDMRDGEFSSFGVRSNNFAIAKGSIIENAIGGVGTDEILGNAADNKLSGGKGADRLAGGAGDDILIGGLNGKHYLTGRPEGDTLVGGSGDDTFLFETAKSALKDEIRDFKSGKDTIDLSLIDANSDIKGNQDFDFIGSRKFSGDGGELSYKSNGGATLLTGDIDGDKKADFSIMLSGKIAFHVDDFIL